MFQRWPDPDHEPIPWGEHDLWAYFLNFLLYSALSAFAWSVPFWIFQWEVKTPNPGDFIAALILMVAWFVGTGIVTVRMFQELVSVVAVIGYRTMMAVKEKWNDYQERRARMNGNE